MNKPLSYRQKEALQDCELGQLRLYTKVAYPVATCHMNTFRALVRKGLIAEKEIREDCVIFQLTNKAKNYDRIVELERELSQMPLHSISVWPRFLIDRANAISKELKKLGA